MTALDPRAAGRFLSSPPSAAVGARVQISMVAPRWEEGGWGAGRSMGGESLPRARSLGGTTARCADAEMGNAAADDGRPSTKCLQMLYIL
uniref:Uncharacterized protein n=1 Tax=Oryza meridionalis TaxID=40149 RepID=A0A0E0FAU3_9ORYZ